MLTALVLAAAIQPDDAAYLRTVQSRNPARCVEIADHDRRMQCRVELGDNPANCNVIGDPTARELCRVREKR
jgi:hypothetical protein